MQDRNFALRCWLHPGMQDRDGLFGRQRKASVEKKCSKGKTESKGLKRVWRGKRHLKETRPERKKGW